MNTIRIIIAVIFAILGVVCIGLVPLSALGANSVAARMNKVYFQPRADTEVDRLIEKGLFTREQESEIRGFVRRLYISDSLILTLGIGAGVIALGISLLSIAHSLKTSVQLSILSQRLKADRADATDKEDRRH